MPFIVELIIVPSVAMGGFGILLKLLDQDANLGICEPFVVDFILAIYYNEGE
jgi:hypothetical protein